jgi:hypothetical protein
MRRSFLGIHVGLRAQHADDRLAVESRGSTCLERHNEGICVVDGARAESSWTDLSWSALNEPKLEL